MRQNRTYIKLISSLLVLILMPFLTVAQNEAPNDFFGNIGKIYVVVGVVMLLFITMIGLLVYLERKVAKLEQEVEFEE